MYFNTNAGLKPLVVSDESTRTTVRREALDVMNGEFTCAVGLATRAASLATAKL